MEIQWEGTEDQQHEARMKACRARQKEFGQCDNRDGSCPECEWDMAVALRVKPSAEGGAA